MAPTAEQITDEYRRLQSRLSGEAAAQVAVAFETLLNPADLDRTFPVYARVVAQILDAARRQVAALAGVYYVTHREAMEVFDEVPPIAYAGALPLDRVTTSLLVTGPVTVKKSLARGQTIKTAFTRARTTTAGAAFRMTVDAGRSTVRDTVRRDRLALGWARVTDGNPCSWCAMLASRGPVYVSEDAAKGATPDHYHDTCGCTPAPIFSRDDPWLGRAREFEALWKDATAGLSGRDAVNAFRRQYERGQSGQGEGPARQPRKEEPRKPKYDEDLLAQAREVDRRASAAALAGNKAEADRLFAEAIAIRRRAYGNA